MEALAIGLAVLALGLAVFAFAQIRTAHKYLRQAQIHIDRMRELTDEYARQSGSKPRGKG